MRSESEVLAILLADIHLSLKPPLWRLAEPDWLETQARSLYEVGLLQTKYECPVICAGDIFDRSRKIADGWNASAELINFAIEHLPNDMYAIPGQHDLPNHQYIDIDRSAYWTLVKADRIKNIPPNDITYIGEHLILSGFPPGYEIQPCVLKVERGEDDIFVAVVHDYIWVPGHSYPNASDERQLLGPNKFKTLKNYNVVVYGDNHKGFKSILQEGGKETVVFNCGTLMRRKSDEIDYKPQLGLLLDNGSVVSYQLDISQDKYITKAEEQTEIALDMGEFFDELEKLGSTALDFKEAMKEFLHRGRTPDEVKQIVLKAMEE